MLIYFKFFCTNIYFQLFNKCLNSFKLKTSNEFNRTKLFPARHLVYHRYVNCSGIELDLIYSLNKYNRIIERIINIYIYNMY